MKGTVHTKYDREYALTRRVPGAVDAVTRRVRDALAAEGFGVLTEIDVQATLERKLDIHRRPYVILGACNPPLAHRALEAEPPVGVLLPCNVTVFEGDDGATYVQAVAPEAMFRVVGNPAMQPIVAEVDARLRRALAAV
jgi:uncharacterized protein (DUF302 family)